MNLTKTIIVNINIMNIFLYSFKEKLILMIFMIKESQYHYFSNSYLWHCLLTGLWHQSPSNLISGYLSSASTPTPARIPPQPDGNTVGRCENPLHCAVLCGIQDPSADSRTWGLCWSLEGHQVPAPWNYGRVWFWVSPFSVFGVMRGIPLLYCLFDIR